MCGIYCSLSHSGHILPSEAEIQLLKRRGPDSCRTVQRVIQGPGTARHYLTFCSSVLSLRGDCVIQQPLEDPSSDSLLCWNGEAWRIEGQEVEGNDAQVVFHLLLEATNGTPTDNVAACFDTEASSRRFSATFSKISGPFAFLFYDARRQRIFFGRDILGRRTLVNTTASDGSFIISSVCSNPTSTIWAEVEADGLYVIGVDWNTEPKHLADDLSQHYGSPTYKPSNVPWSHAECDASIPTVLQSPFPTLNGDCPTAQPPTLGLDSPAVSEVEKLLTASLTARVKHIPLPPSSHSPVRLAILFSGGLDCTLLARLCHDILPMDQSIDLLNVAFENPRVINAASQNSAQPLFSGKKLYSSCPDRITGLNSHTELLSVCPERTWRFVSIDVPYQELQAHRSQILSLIHPHNTEMDLSIATALYFAAHGVGTTRDSTSNLASPYTTPARVLLSGLGADELFGGYVRHATAFKRKSYEGLVQELQVDFLRLGTRNLGRDDRVISHWGKEARYPYLDEIMVGWALRSPVWEKCGFGQTLPAKATYQRYPPLDPAKAVLRLLAWKLGMNDVAAEKKRAIQFGARTAKMETGRTKGTQVVY